MLSADAIIRRLRTLEILAAQLPIDADWQSHPIAVEYRQLLRAWWQLNPIEKLAYQQSIVRLRLVMNRLNAATKGTDNDDCYSD